MLEAVSRAQDAFVWRKCDFFTRYFTKLTCVVVWKRKKDFRYLGSVHGGELSEFFGTSEEVTDKVALDSTREFVLQSLGPWC
jgi:hypothetical protein